MGELVIGHIALSSLAVSKGASAATGNTAAGSARHLATCVRALNVASFAHARRLSGAWLERSPEGSLRRCCISIAFMVHNICVPPISPSHRSHLMSNVAMLIAVILGFTAALVPIAIALHMEHVEKARHTAVQKHTQIASYDRELVSI